MPTNSRREFVLAAAAVLASAPLGGVMALADPLFVAEQTLIARSALAHRLPSVFARNENVEAGGLMSYGPTIEDQFHQAAAYVSRILKGANPGELPIEQPTRFKFVLNLRTAKALGVRIPQSILAQADEIIK